MCILCLEDACILCWTEAHGLYTTDFRGTVEGRQERIHSRPRLLAGSLRHRKHYSPLVSPLLVRASAVLCGICGSSSCRFETWPSWLGSARTPVPSPPLTVGLHGQLLPGPLGPSPGGAALLTPVLGGRRSGCPDNRGRAGGARRTARGRDQKVTWKRRTAHGREWRRGSGPGSATALVEPRPELGKALSASAGTTRTSAGLGKLPPGLCEGLGGRSCR